MIRVPLSDGTGWFLASHVSKRWGERTVVDSQSGERIGVWSRRPGYRTELLWTRLGNWVLAAFAQTGPLPTDRREVKFTKISPAQAEAWLVASGYGDRPAVTAEGQGQGQAQEVGS